MGGHLDGAATARGTAVAGPAPGDTQAHILAILTSGLHPEPVPPATRPPLRAHAEKGRYFPNFFLHPACDLTSLRGGGFVGAGLLGDQPPCSLAPGLPPRLCHGHEPAPGHRQPCPQPGSLAVAPGQQGHLSQPSSPMQRGEP